ncbi:MAG: amidohydrolase family protein [Methanothrix sp.]|uniref:Amidohydrolase n=1 Tax=Methanothrix thermoacetophila (strain DSM 6194 / JCM 14653 / NBRC 101360 / PT) TaxID=349307 RepID=A0B6S0_METTP|nr:MULTISPECIES: amidohydrolase family protein [Methanothrix]ABK14394.1 amidohydrolase [Methanothrix thermoacetophila PT]MBC7079611.1 amidohydrolase family protein [Methanothrix sp.]NPU87580.1 amidohydrolase family protein [Methanothrix sp.]
MRRIDEDVNKLNAPPISKYSGPGSLASASEDAGFQDELILSGTVIAGEDMVVLDGYVVIENGVIKEIGEGKERGHLEGIICPAFVNAHTHVADSIAKDPPFMDLADLVGPGGLKHRILESASDDLLVESMRFSVSEMLDTGTCVFGDFREGGSHGVELLLRAIEGLGIQSRIFGRPLRAPWDIHPACWGVGLSSTRDYDQSFVDEVVRIARKEGKRIAIHAGEAGRDDIDGALALDPDILIHLSRAERSDLRDVAESGASVVVCPRSNLFTRAGLPDVSSMLSLGINVCVGTDNIMINSTNIFREMELLSKALVRDDRQVFMMCTINGARALGMDERLGSVDPGKEARVMVFDRNSRNMRGSLNPLGSIVRRAEPSDIILRI